VSNYKNAQMSRYTFFLSTYQPHSLPECVADIGLSRARDRIEFTFVVGQHIFNIQSYNLTNNKGIRSELGANAVDTGLPKIQISTGYYHAVIIATDMTYSAKRV
jgi:hypothetical protein